MKVDIRSAANRDLLMTSARGEDVALLPAPTTPLPVPEREHLVFTVCREPEQNGLIIVAPLDRTGRMQAGKLQFRANFCSANLASAKEGALPLVRRRIEDAPEQETFSFTFSFASEFHPWMQEFDLCTFQDNHGTPQQTGHRSWFYFGVSGHDKVGIALSVPTRKLVKTLT